jgi:hypothetical protein
VGVASENRSRDIDVRQRNQKTLLNATRKMNQRAYFNIITPSNEEAELYIDVYWNEEVEDSEKVLVEWGVLWSNSLTQPSFITREILIEKMNKIDYSI